MNFFWSKIKLNKKTISIVILFCILLVLFVNIEPSFAQVVDTVKANAELALGGVGAAVAIVLGIIAYLITAVIGLLITLIIAVLIQVASFSGIINVPTVMRGWVIVRDLVNMFFILILLVIAFATILRIESYSAKRLLPKLLIMAVLINFSKTIFGLLIDFSQVIMLTFVAAFKDGGGWFIEIFQTKFLLSIRNAMNTDKAGDFAVGSWSTVVAIIAGVLAAIITLITITVLLIVLVFRIVMLWVYTILSPLVFMGFGFPPIQKYTGRIWEDFVKQLVVGPMLAFFIWLALTTVTTSADQLKNFELSQEVCAGVGQFFCQGEFQKFIITIALLMGGLMVTQQIGGLAGAAAGKGMQWAKRAGSLAAAGALLPLRGAKELASFGVDKLHEKTGIDLNIPRVLKGIQEKREEKRAERYSDGKIAAQRAMAEKGRLWGLAAMSGSPGHAWEQITSWKGIKQRMRGGRYMTRKSQGVGAKATAAAERARDSENDLKKLQAQRETLISGGEYKQLRQNMRDKEYEWIDAGYEVRRQEAVLNNVIGTSAEAEEREKLERLREKRQAILTELRTMRKKRDSSMVASDLDINLLGNQIASKKDEIKAFRAEEEKHKIVAEKYVPSYDFDARAAEQKVVSEKMGKIKDITDASELFRILREAISEKDKAMIKAISKKMAMNGDDNEALQPLVGHTGAEGLQKFMHKLIKEANFSEQEAFGLGSEISAINKGTNHWAATAAYKMENGRWRETDKHEQLLYRSVETGKMHQQSLLRSLNRLAYGFHGQEGEFHLDEGGIMLLKKLDNPTAIRMIEGGNMQESAARYIAPHVDILEQKGSISPQLARAIRDRARSIVQNFEDEYQRAIQDLKNIGQAV